MKKIIAAFGLLVALFVVVSIVWGVTASYNQTIRIVDSAGTVINGVASATTGLYNETVRVVDSNGNVIDSFAPTPGPPSATPTPIAANLVYAGPASGAAAQPTFRSIVLADIANVVAALFGYSFPTLYGAQFNGIVKYDGAIAAAGNSGNSTTLNAPAMTTHFAGDVLLTVFGFDNTPNTPTVAVPTPRATNVGGAGYYGVYLGDQPVPVATTVAAVTGSLSSTHWMGYSIPIKAAAASTIAFVNATLNHNASGSNLQLSVPSGTTDGMWMLACLADATPISVIPTGWTRFVPAINNGGANFASCYDRIASSEPANYTWTCTTTCYPGGFMATYSGVDTSYPIDGAKLASAGASFTNADVGKQACIENAGGTGVSQCGPISAVIDGTDVVPDFLASAAASSAMYDYATLDDTAFASAFAALATSGGTIWLPSGVTGLTTTQTFPCNVTVNLHGAGASLLRYLNVTGGNATTNYAPSGSTLMFMTTQMSGGALSFSSVGGTMCHNADHISDLTLWGSAGSGGDGGGSDGIYVRNQESVLFDDVVVGNFKAWGIDIGAITAGTDWADNVIFVGGALDFNGSGGYNIGSANGVAFDGDVVQNAQILNNYGPGMSFVNGKPTGVFINNNLGWNQVNGTTGSAEVLSAAGLTYGGLTLMNNHIEPLASRNGVNSDVSGIGISLIRNNFYGNAGTSYGIKYGSSASSLSTNATLTGNTFNGTFTACAQQMFIAPSVTGSSNSCTTGDPTFVTYLAATSCVGNGNPVVCCTAAGVGANCMALPAAAAANIGQIANVVDETTACTPGGIYNPSSTVHNCQVRSNGTNWIVTGMAF